MDPVSAVGLAASSLQLASFAFTVGLRTIRLVKDLKDVPARLRVCLADAENSVQRLSDLQSMLIDPHSRLVTLLDQGQLSKLESVVRDGRDATDALREKLESLFPQRTTPSSSSGRDRVKAAWKNVVSLGMEKEVEGAIRRIQWLNDEITRELQIVSLETQAQLSVDFAVAYRREHEVTRSELRWLRDAVLPVLTGHTHAMPAANQAVAFRLSDTDKSDLTKQLCEALVSHPSALRQSCDNIPALSGDHYQVRAASKWKKRQDVCVCSKSRKSYSRRLISGVDLAYQSSADHHPACPFASYGGQSSSYTVSLTLLPLLSRTVAVSFNSRSGGGGWSISPGLRFFATVQRKTSPLFRAFDDERNLHIAEIHRSIMDMMAAGTGSLTDRDEYGSTILYEIAQHIWRGWARRGKLIIAPQVGDLLRLAYVARVDVNNEVSKGRNVIWFIRAFTQDFEAAWELLGPDYFGKFDVLSEPYAYRIRRGHVYLGRLFYSRFEELAEELGPIGLAVLQTSVDRLRQVLQNPTFNVGHYGAHCREAVMCLATPWHDGLRLLLEAGFDVRWAVDEALRQNDLEALKITIGYPGWDTETALIWACYSSDSLQQFVVDAIVERRNDLLQLCYDHLTAPELAGLGLPSCSPLDAKVTRAYELLSTKGILCHSTIFERPVYSVCGGCINGRIGPRRQMLVEKLYAAGFCEDAQGGFVTRMFCRISFECLEVDWDYLVWRFKNLVTALGSTVKNWPSALFNAAIVYGTTWLHDHRELCHEGMIACLRILATSCTLTQRDGCECFCSRGGCLPSPVFLTLKLEPVMENLRRSAWSRKARELVVQNWCDACQLDGVSTGVYLEDTIRLEVFDRLGMVHTCCEVRHDSETDDDCGLICFEACCAPEEERQQIQYEDAELHEQLELIMEAYQRYSETHAGVSREAMLRGWWHMLDQILLPVDPVAVVSRESDSYESNSCESDNGGAELERAAQRSEAERAALVRLGYGDLDFTEVIQRHFREYLTDGDDTTTANGPDKKLGNRCASPLSKEETALSLFTSGLRPGDRQPRTKRRNSF